MPSSACQTCARSEEHTSELQSHDNLVCRLLLEKKKNPIKCARLACCRTSRGCDAFGSASRKLLLLLPPTRPPLPFSAPLPHDIRCFFFNNTATPEIYPLSLPAPLPI